MLVAESVTILMYLADWMVQATSEAAALESTAVTLRLCGDLGFVFIFPQSLLSPTRSVTWLGMAWDSRSASLALSVANRAKIVATIRRTLLARTCGLRLWTGLLGSLNYAAQVVSLGRL